MRLSWAGALLTTAAIALPGVASAKNGVVRIGVLNDMSGIFSDFQGPGSLLAAQMAVEDFGGKVAGMPVEVVVADHQNKTDIGVAKAREWLDKSGVDAIFDVPNSAIALGVSNVVRENNSALIALGGSSAEITGAKCSPNTIQWVTDNWAQANGIATAAVRAGAKKWFFLTADYAFGHDLERQAGAAVTKEAGAVLGAVRHPFGASDFSSFLLQAQSSGAQVVGLANAGGDTSNAIKQAAEFGLRQQGIKVAGLMFQVNTVHALGLPTTQGILTISPFYWDANDQTRTWSKRFVERYERKQMPNEYQAGTYSAVTHYLKAVQALGSAEDGLKVIDKMKELPTEDILYGKGRIRADGRKIHPMYLYEVKTPAESKAAWDYFKLVATVAADEAFRPLNQGNCPLVTK